MSEPITLEAHKIVGGDRREAYGPVDESFQRIAKMWSVIFDKEVTPGQVALAMICLKVCREKNKPQRDNRVDIAGYAELLDLLSEVPK